MQLGEGHLFGPAHIRGNSDAINVHPVEFLTGEYLHLGAIVLVPMSIHVTAIATFIVLGGLLASLNHTRFNFKVPPGTPFLLLDVCGTLGICFPFFFRTF